MFKSCELITNMNSSHAIFESKHTTFLKRFVELAAKYAALQSQK